MKIREMLMELAPRTMDVAERDALVDAILTPGTLHNVAFAMGRAAAAADAQLGRHDPYDRAATLFTSADLARFCRVDLKTIHNWTDRGSIEHFRTPGRHLRFTAASTRDFLERAGFPVPDEVLRCFAAPSGEGEAQ